MDVLIQLSPLCEPRPGVSWQMAFETTSVSPVLMVSLTVPCPSYQLILPQICQFKNMSPHIHNREFNKEMGQVTVITCTTVLTRNLLICSSPV